MSRFSKKELRKEYKAKRQELSDNEREKLSEQIAEKLLTEFDWKDHFVHVFIPIARFNEADTWPLIRKFWTMAGIRVSTSVTDFEGDTLRHFEIFDTTRFKKSSWGIDEPEDGEEIDPKEINRVLIPLLAFDKQGYRVGYGKGFYDKFLSMCNPNTERIGISFFPPIDQIEDVADHDVKLTSCVTPDGIFRF
ncbi:5-formyltetrahydrofolate cyclo-ligase [Halocola ammonii]